MTHLNQSAALKVAALENQNKRLREALKRLVTPLAFHNAGSANPEEQARMVFAQAILDGKTLKTAESHAVARARRTHEELLKKSQRD